MESDPEAHTIGPLLGRETTPASGACDANGRAVTPVRDATVGRFRPLGPGLTAGSGGGDVEVIA